MNQYRCETCNNCDKSGQWWYCNISDISINPLYCIELIEYVGCASHSDFQSERDKVLDELVEWLDEQVPKKDLEHPFYECKTRTKGKIAELQQQAGDQ